MALMHKGDIFFEKFRQKVLRVSKKALPLHSLFENTFSVAPGEVGEWLKPAVC